MINVEINNEKTIHFAEHEVFLSFYNDTNAENFYYWWTQIGQELFSKYTEMDTWEDRDKLVERIVNAIETN